MSIRQVCIIGGTFNPIHMGHLQIARSAQAQCMADEVWFLPAGQPWQKSGSELAPAEIRQYLIELSIEGVHSWRIEPFEIQHQGPTYTVDTLEALTDLHPKYKFNFVIGTDQLSNLTNWKHWKSLFDFARIGVADRTEWGEFKVPNELKRYLLQDHLFRIPMPSVNISSSQIRRQFALLSSSNNPDVIETTRHTLETFLPANVFKYLMDHPIYGPTQP
jgi:nicotinate-nucleotide adenylyltransferase